MSDERRIGRREFLKDVARAVVVTLAVGGTAALARKSGARRETCAGDGICARCSDLRRCGLPQAMSARSVRGE